MSALGHRVRILHGPYEGAVGKVEDIVDDEGYSHLVYDRQGVWCMGWYRPQDLEPLEES